MPEAPERDSADAEAYKLRTGNGIEKLDDYDFDENFTEIVNLPVMPLRYAFCVRNLGVLAIGNEIMIEREDGLWDKRVIRAIDRSRNLVELEKPMTGWPMMGGFVQKILGYNRHYVNLKQMEQVKKCILQGGKLLDKSLLNGKTEEEIVETLDC